eukprot:10085-Amphidinium_carterae.1
MSRILATAILAEQRGFFVVCCSHFVVILEITGIFPGYLSGHISVRQLRLQVLDMKRLSELETQEKSKVLKIVVLDGEDKEEEKEESEEEHSSGQPILQVDDDALPGERDAPPTARDEDTAQELCAPLEAPSSIAPLAARGNDQNLELGSAK